MRIKGITDEDFVNYKKPSIFIAFPYCTFKCEKESGICCCQNSSLAQSPDIDIPICKIVDRYMQNSITSAIVCGGLEPLDSPIDLVQLINCIRKKTDDDIVIYTGFEEDEVEDFISYIKKQQFKNIIIKFGRYIPGDEPHYDHILGVNLASDNQYAVRIK